MSCPTIVQLAELRNYMVITPVSTRLGKLIGLSKSAVTEYRGIPYAQPAEGEWRLRAPRPVEPWEGVKECTSYAGASWQESNALLGVTHQSLDCLRLNIWVPHGEGPFPVMVWLHGGGYINGSASQLLYHGEKLAAQQQVIVVNVGYRLGALGFGDFSEWLPDCDSNRGLRDQLAALEWINAHISDFGGNPDQVTIFGESAGGFSVACLLAMPQASRLFHAAIMQSGAGDMVVSAEESARITRRFVDEIGGYEQLLHADSRTWVKAQRPSYGMSVLRGLRASTPQFGMTWLPSIDNDLLTDLPVNAIAAGSAIDKRLLVSVCRDEWNLFQYALPFNGNKSIDTLREVDAAGVLQRFKRALPLADDAESALAVYAKTPFHPARCHLDWYAAEETDRLFIVPSVRLLDAQVAAGGRAHAAIFTHETTMMGLPVGACHVSDVPFVFDLVDKPIGQFFSGGTQATELAREVQAVWGDMASGRRLGWPEWAPQRLARVLGPEAASDDVSAQSHATDAAKPAPAAGVLSLAPLLTADKEALWERFIPTTRSD